MPTLCLPQVADDWCAQRNNSSPKTKGMKTMITALFAVMLLQAGAQNNAIFGGGTADGWSSNSVAQAVGNIFTGGSGDGWAGNNYAQAGNSIFSGGPGDGWTFSFFAQNGNAIFGGGQGDGWANTYRPLGALPVQFVSFTAEKRGSTALLQWQTAGEKDAAYFDVERSAAAGQFKKIGRVAAAGNSTAGQRYTFPDAAPLSGPNYYRLKQVDANGQFLYSVIRVAVFGEGTAPVKVYPVPATAWLTVEIPKALREQEVALTLSNAAGVTMGEVRLPKGGTVQIINVQNLAAGVYHLQLSANGYQNTVRIIKQ